jgi:ketosteroid isomerase-like protein
VSNETVARDYLAALGNGDAGEQLRRFFTDDFEQVEYPNALNPRGQRSNLSQTLERSEKGKLVLRGQRYDVQRVVVAGDAMALEVDWTGVLAIQIGALKSGQEMRANFAVFLDFRDGRISRQRNYDCFQPF